jgi:hypothetical protein
MSAFFFIAVGVPSDTNLLEKREQRAWPSIRHLEASEKIVSEQKP